MLGIIVCQLQPSKSTFELIKENFLFICFSVVLLYFWPRQNKTSKLWQPRKDKKLWFSALSPSYARDYFRVKEHKSPDPRGKEKRRKRETERESRRGERAVSLNPCAFSGGVQYSHTYTGMCRPTGSWFWSSWFRTGYPFQRRFLERGIIFRTRESSGLVSSRLKLFKDRMLLKMRFSALTSKLLYSSCLERSIKNWPISRRGYQF